MYIQCKYKSSLYSIKYNTMHFYCIAQVARSNYLLALRVILLIQSTIRVVILFASFISMRNINVCIMHLHAAQSFYRLKLFLYIFSLSFMCFSSLKIELLRFLLP